MIRTKTLSLPLVSALLATAVVPAQADVALQLSTHKTFRQNKAGKSVFRGGNFDISLRDGDGIWVGGCARTAYWPPNLDPCPGGSTGFVTYGDPTGTNQGPYFWFTSVIPALIIEPRRPELCILRAAPASDLPRPYSGFKDTSYGIYYNLHEADVVESVVTRYNSRRTYSPKQLGKFTSEIVPGVYHYQFPRLKSPVLNVTVTPVIYPMPEGYAELNNQKFGVRITPTTWTKDGFMELSYIRPNVIKWSGFSPTVVHASVDNLYFSMRYMANEKSPLSELTYTNPETGESPSSFFPGFVSGGDPRILLANPFVTSFTLPPIFPGGSKAVIELELDRAFQTGGITYDFSTRKYQIPVIIINRYTEYSELRFGSKTKDTSILDDYDKDGYNNLNEWILDSRADDSTSIPLAPVAANVPPVFDATGFFIIEPQYFGFAVTKKKGTRPLINYTLQRSTNSGKTWKEFVSDADWTVTETPAEIKVESAILGGNGTFIQPPGTAGDLYRVKITLAK